MARCRNTISRPRAIGISSPRILAGLPTRWVAKGVVRNVARMSEAKPGSWSTSPAYRGACHRAALRADPLAHAGYPLSRRGKYDTKPPEALVGLVAGRGVERNQRSRAVVVEAAAPSLQ